MSVSLPPSLSIAHAFRNGIENKEHYEHTMGSSGVSLSEWMSKLVWMIVLWWEWDHLQTVCSILNWIKLAENNIWCLLVLHWICRSWASLLKCGVCPYNCSLGAMWHLLNRFKHFLINYAHISCGTGFFTSWTFISTLSLSAPVDKPTLSHSVTFSFFALSLSLIQN